MQIKKFLVIIFLSSFGWLTPKIGQCTFLEDEPSQFIRTIPVEQKLEIFKWLPEKSVWDLRLVCQHLNMCANAHIRSFIAPSWGTDNDIVHLVAKFPNITALYLNYNHHIKGENFALFLPKLKILHLGQNELLSDEIMMNLSNLESLNLGDFSKEITNEGITKLIKLKELTVGHSNNLITNQGISLMTQLTKLTINCNNYDFIDEASVACLINLRELNVPTLDKKIKIFAGLTHLTNLTSLHLRNRDHINHNDYVFLRDTLPNLTIWWDYNNNSNSTWPVINRGVIMRPTNVLTPHF